MVQCVVLFCLIIAFPIFANAADCSLDGVQMDPLHRDILEKLGLDLSGELLSFVTFKKLSVDFGEIDSYPVQINAEGDFWEYDLVPVTIDIWAKVDSISAHGSFVSEIKVQLPAIKKEADMILTDDDVEVHGRGTELMNQNRLRFKAIIQTTHKLWIRLAETKSSVYLDITIKGKNEGKDLGLHSKFTVKGSDANTIFANIINLVTAPVWIATEILDVDSLGQELDVVSKIIEHEIDKSTGRREHQVRSFDVASVNNRLKANLQTDVIGFVDVFADKLRHTELSRFYGPGHPLTTSQDSMQLTNSGTFIRLNKASVPVDDYSTYLQYKKACLFQSGLNRLKRLNDELNGTAVLGHEVAAGDNLHKISVKHFGSAEYAMAISQFNDLSDPNYIRVGDVVSIPELSALMSTGVHIVRPRDTLWDIVSNADGHQKRLPNVISRNSLPQGPDLIYPGMFILLE